MNERTADQWAAALHSNLVQASLSLQHRCVSASDQLAGILLLSGRVERVLGFDPWGRRGLAVSQGVSDRCELTRQHWKREDIILGQMEGSQPFWNGYETV